MPYTKRKWKQVIIEIPENTKVLSTTIIYGDYSKNRVAADTSIYDENDLAEMEFLPTDIEINKE